MKHIGYPSIEQFQNVIRNVKHAAQYVGQAEDGSTIMNRNATMPTLKFRGTGKIHGTNSAVAFNLHTGDMWFQSRERIITPEQDNAGFAMFATAREDYFLELIRRIDDVSCTQKYIVIFGEFFGKGVQKGVAVSELPKTFCVFDIMVVDEDDSRIYFPRKLVEYVMEQRTENVVCIYDFPTWEMDIDFENPQLAQPKLIELTMAVEAECPVGKAFGVSSVGEGIVWKCIDENDDFHNSGFWFKVKGPRHQMSKVKTLAPVDVERYNTLQELATSLATEPRLEQMAQQTFDLLNGGEVDIKRMGDFIKAVMKDILKEEIDSVAASGFTTKEISGPISKISRDYIMRGMSL